MEMPSALFWYLVIGCVGVLLVIWLAKASYEWLIWFVKELVKMQLFLWLVNGTLMAMLSQYVIPYGQRLYAFAVLYIPFLHPHQT